MCGGGCGGVDVKLVLDYADKSYKGGMDVTMVFILSTFCLCFIIFVVRIITKRKKELELEEKKNGKHVVSFVMID